MHRVFKEHIEIPEIGKILFVKGTPNETISRFIERVHPIRTEYELIRIGPNGDGGYLVPNDLQGIKACFSPGVGRIADFEFWCYQHGMEIYFADNSINQINTEIPRESYHFTKKHVGCMNNDSTITLDSWVDSTMNQDISEDLLLQMDIEGGEYEVLINLSDDLLSRFRILVIEFHFLGKLWNPDMFWFADIAFEKILQTHSCVHIHPNNCCGIDARNGIPIPRVAEFTFLRKDRIQTYQPATTFPHPLDFDNVPRGRPITLPKNWYKHQ